MMHARIWRTMTSVTVEITCHHAEGQTGGSHLVYREAVHDVRDQPEHLILVVSECVARAALLAWQDELPGLTAECGWT